MDSSTSFVPLFAQNDKAGVIADENSIGLFDFDFFKGIYLEEHQRLVGIALTIVLGIGAQWLGWRVRLPAILLLLVFGFIAGPVTHILDPNKVFGGLLFPIISFAVAVILFEGGLTLRLSQLPHVGAVLWRLLSVGALATWVVGTLGAHYLVGIQDWGVALLLGAILVVTGPTVIGPLLRHVRPTAKVSSILNWEGIVIDPIGAVLAVIVFEAIVGHSDGWQFIALSIGKTLLFGGGVGLVAAGALASLLRRFWIPDELQNPAVLAFVAGAFAFSNHLQAESGLVAVTLMGVILANQKWIAVGHIVEFKENLRVLLISGLFILLAARLRVEELREIGWGSIAFLVLMVIVARPLSVFLSTIGTKVTLQEKLFLSWMAPRGIVAAAVASIFAQRLLAMDEPLSGAESIVPVTVVIIVGTVALYGLTASFVAKKLGIAKPAPNGVMIVGANDWSRKIAEALKKAGISVLMVDTDVSNTAAAKMAGLTAQHTSIMSKVAHEAAEQGEYGRLVALTRNDEVNALACMNYIELFGRAGVFQLSFKRAGHARHESVGPNQRGRLIFDRGTSWTQLNEAFAKGATVKATKLSAEFTYEDLRDRYGVYAIPLFLITEKGELFVIAADSQIEPNANDTIITLIPGEKAAEEKVEKVVKKVEEAEKKAVAVEKKVEKEKAKEAANGAATAPVPN